MAKSSRPIADEPWHAEFELELRDRPGIEMVTLLTDECGCLLLADGIIPAYLQRQARAALNWNATENRGIAKQLLESERRRASAGATEPAGGPKTKS